MTFWTSKKHGFLVVQSTHLQFQASNYTKRWTSSHRQSSTLVICHHCNRSRHYTWECPQSFDIWTITTQERLELLLELLALADTSENPALEMEHLTEWDEGQQEGEDFATCSGWIVCPHCIHTISFPVFLPIMRKSLHPYLRQKNWLKWQLLYLQKHLISDSRNGKGDSQ